MAGRRTNLALFIALSVALLTGGLAFAIGTSLVRSVLIAHGAAGFSILILSPWKSMIVRRGMRRQRAGKSASIGFSVLVLVALLSGVAHSTGLVRFIGPVSIMQLHVGAALAAVPLLVFHVMARPAPLRRTDLGRRNLVRSAGLGVAGVALYAGKETLLRLTSSAGGGRRFTGSFERGSFRPELMPVTQWLNDSVQVIDPATFVLAVDDRNFTLEGLLERRDRVRATIDCTGGWYSEQDWEGVRLDRLIRPTTRSIEVVSRTGYSRLFPARDVGALLLATRLGGEPLAPGHGGPVRLVAPDRRGFWWVKWVDRVSSTDRPSWVQSPFPLT